MKQHLTAKASVPFTADGLAQLHAQQGRRGRRHRRDRQLQPVANATRNAENVLRITSADLAGQYAAYVDGLVQRYAPAPAPARPAGRKRRSRRLFHTTKTEDRVMVAAATSGLARPRAASGMASTL